MVSSSIVVVRTISVVPTIFFWQLLYIHLIIIVPIVNVIGTGKDSNFRKQTRHEGYCIHWIRVSVQLGLSDTNAKVCPYALKVYIDSLSKEIHSGCQTSYYHNFRVKDGIQYYYEGELPELIQVGEHQFVERKVVFMWTIDTNISAYVSHL
jgi:hypothetical protein